MKLVYWYSRCRNDSDCYSVIAKTKKAAEAEVDQRGSKNFDPPEKREIYYESAFDLFELSTGEGGGRGCGISV